jgi:hypothetical protein
MINAIKNSINYENYVVSNVPRKRSRILKYGFDHSREIAEAISKKLGLKYVKLLESKSKAAQKKLHGDARIKNAEFDILKKHPLDFASVDITEERLDTYEPDKPDITTLLYQTGYLTIKNFCQFGALRKYDLGFPNLEVQNSFVAKLAPAYTGIEPSSSDTAQIMAAEALYTHNVAKFITALKVFFRNIPYDLTDKQNEQMWQTIVYVVLKALGVGVFGEVKTNDGRIDMVVDLPNDIYIIEFKLDKPAAEAMEQIKSKEYAGKYALSGKRITLIAISFSSEKRTIVEELVEEL